MDSERSYPYVYCTDCLHYFHIESSDDDKCPNCGSTNITEDEDNLDF